MTTTYAEDMTSLVETDEEEGDVLIEEEGVDVSIGVGVDTGNEEEELHERYEVDEDEDDSNKVLYVLKADTGMVW